MIEWNAQNCHFRSQQINFIQILLFTKCRRLGFPYLPVILYARQFGQKLIMIKYPASAVKADLGL